VPPFILQKRTKKRYTKQPEYSKGSTRVHENEKGTTFRNENADKKKGGTVHNERDSISTARVTP